MEWSTQKQRCNFPKVFMGFSCPTVSPRAALRCGSLYSLTFHFFLIFPPILLVNSRSCLSWGWMDGERHEFNPDLLQSNFSQLLLQFSLPADAQSTCSWEWGPGKGEGGKREEPDGAGLCRVLQNNRWSLLIMAAWMSIALPAPFLLLSDQYALNCRRKAVSYTITAQWFNHLDA